MLDRMYPNLSDGKRILLGILLTMVISIVFLTAIIGIAWLIISSFTHQYTATTCQDLGRLNDLAVQVVNEICYVHIGEHWIPSDQVGVYLR